MTYVNIAVPVPLHMTFTYKVPEGLTPQALPGTRVVVPFRNRKRIGYITEFNVKKPAGTEIKKIDSFPDNGPLVSENLLKLINWISEYYSAPIGEVFAAATPNLLTNAKALEKKRRKTSVQYEHQSFKKEKPIELNNSQKKIWKELCNLCDPGKFNTALIHGVTGSGKTEIYLKLIDKITASGKSAILLVPEISLTPQLAGRVIAHFGDKVAVYHSGLTEVQRLNQWQQMKKGKVKIVVGTRSAVYAPLENPGVIIIDEEHDYSYKQEDSPRYNARDTAIMRGKLESTLVVLGSATPSLETLTNAKNGKYKYFHLLERHGNAVMPEIKIIDMRKEIKSNLLNPYLSLELMSEIKRTLKNKQQVLLFLNRRGYANFFLCQDCGYIPECPNCQITLTFHKKARGLRCHYCNYQIRVPDVCPKCRGAEMTPIGSGTEMVEEVIRETIPAARIDRFDRDTITTDKKRRELLEKMHGCEIDILIGTQMITKGHDFPNVTLVGIISADQSIHFPDFRASERTFQLLTQVSGRAGRALHPGKVIIQTYSPEHTSIQTASEQSLDEFISKELAVRKELSYPPFSRLANVRITGNKEGLVIDASKRIHKLLCENGKLKLLGPAPAPLAMLKGKARWQILVKSPSAKLLAGSLTALKTHIDNQPIRGVQISIDVDPVSIM